MKVLQTNGQRWHVCFRLHLFIYLESFLILRVLVLRDFAYLWCRPKNPKMSLGLFIVLDYQICSTTRTDLCAVPHIVQAVEGKTEPDPRHNECEGK